MRERVEDLFRERERKPPLLTPEEADRIARAVARWKLRPLAVCDACGGSGKGRKKFATCWECRGQGVVEEGDDGDDLRQG